MKSNKKIIAITQARVGSTRLPGKVLKVIGDKTLLQIHLERATKSKLINTLILATTDLEKDDPIALIGKKMNLNIFRGSETDVIDRYYKAALKHEADIIVRITSDCPLIDPQLMDQVVKKFLENSNCDFCSNITERTFPDGMDVEVFSMEALTKAWQEATSAADREHVTFYIWKNSNLMKGNIFKAVNVLADNKENYSKLRLTLDYSEDYEFFKRIIEMEGIDKGWLDYVKFLNLHPELVEINKHVG